METVIVVYILAQGHALLSSMPADHCRALAAMTAQAGSVELELTDGRTLKATRVECRPYRPDHPKPAAAAPSQ